MLKNPFSVLAVHKKGSKSNFLEQNTNFFVNDARFVRKHVRAYSKLVGTPSSTQVLRKSLICFFLCLSFSRCNHDGFRTKLGARLVGVEKLPFKGLLRKMGSKLSCSCGPLKIKGYRFVFWILRLFVFFLPKNFDFTSLWLLLKKVLDSCTSWLM